MANRTASPEKSPAVHGIHRISESDPLSWSGPSPIRLLACVFLVLTISAAAAAQSAYPPPLPGNSLQSTAPEGDAKPAEAPAQPVTVLQPAGTESRSAQAVKASSAEGKAAPLRQEEVPNPVREVQRPSPYDDLPSLHDLYTQLPPEAAKLHRFGSDVFLNGSGNAEILPVDLPAGPDYVLGPGDSLVVNLWGGHSDRLTAFIDRQGQIALPEAGTVMLDGLTIAQAEAAIRRALDTQYQGEHVEISLGRVRTVRVYVVGDVQRPGAYDVSSLSTPLSALFAAGGPTGRGSLRLLRHYRGQRLLHEIDLYDFLLRGLHSDQDRLLPGDTLLVPPVGAQVTVEGMVRRPAIYELNGEQGLDRVLEMAGGVLASASLKQIDVERVETHQRRTMFRLELPEDPSAANQKLAGFHVEDQDDVVLAPILPYNHQAVYLDGHVYRPGK